MKLLFICTHNRCRSILAEAITNHYSGGELIAASAGSSPVGKVHPLTLRFLSEMQIPIDGLKSQSWDELEDFAPDVVITVCDSAAKETCPVWFGRALQVHWGLADPSKVVGSEEEISDAFHSVISELIRRIKCLLTADMSTLTKEEWPHLFESIVQGPNQATSSVATQ